MTFKIKLILITIVHILLSAALIKIAGIENSYGILLSVLLALSIFSYLTFKKEVTNISNSLLNLNIDNTSSIQTSHKEINNSASLILQRFHEHYQGKQQENKMNSLSDMASGVAHEINNPLAVLKLKVKKLSRSQEDSSDISKQLNTLAHDIDRINEVVSGLKAFSQDSDNENRSITSVEDVIDEVIALSKNEVEKLDTKLLVHKEEGLSINCDMTQISQAVLNLVFNALEATSKSNQNSKEVSLKVFSEDSLIKFQVSDKGALIDGELDKIFEPFYTTKEVGEGQGLGLSISKGIAQSLNGELLLSQSEQEKIFSLVLPSPSVN